MHAVASGEVIQWLGRGDSATSRVKSWDCEVVVSRAVLRASQGVGWLRAVGREGAIDLSSPSRSFTMDATKPGSEVAAETAAALAAALMVFQSSDPDYAKKLLERAIMVFDFADAHRGSYSESLGKWVCPFYCDFSGYEDELVWGAVWIYKASNNNRHWKYVQDNINKLDQNFGEFGWDSKHAGTFVLLYENSSSDHIKQKAAEVVCSLLTESPTIGVTYCPGGLMFKKGGSNMQHPTSLSFLLLFYALSGGGVVGCGNTINASPSRLIEVAKGQVDYILGDNPLAMSYMVGYGLKFPQKIHHRGSSLPSLAQPHIPFPYDGGTPYFNSSSPNPNLLTGAIVGGPEFANDAYTNSRALFMQLEPTTYINAPMVGLLAYFKAVKKDKTI